MTKKESIFVFPQFLRERSLKKKVKNNDMQNALLTLLLNTVGCRFSQARFLRGHKCKIKRKTAEMFHLINEDLCLLDYEATGLK